MASKEKAAKASANSDTELVKRALEKRAAGKTPNQREARALKRWETQREETARWKYYRTIPLKHWCEMSGRSHQVLYKQAKAHGLPFGQPVISLPDVVKDLHDFLARNAAKLRRAETDEELLFGEGGPVIDRLRLAKAQLAELDLAQRRGLLLPRDVTHERLGQMASILRRAGEILQRQFGEDAHRILDEALDECERTIEEWSAEDGAESDSE